VRAAVCTQWHDPALALSIFDAVVAQPLVQNDGTHDSEGNESHCAHSDACRTATG
jgi:hypothetical protein